jgi:protein-disulfide isomerase
MPQSLASNLPKEGDIVRKLIQTGTGAALAVFLAAAPAPVLAQESKDDLKKEIDALKQGQQEILKQLDEIKKLVVARQAPAAPSGPNVKDIVFNLGANPTKGPATAKLTLVEFTDYQ